MLTMKSTRKGIWKSTHTFHENYQKMYLEVNSVSIKTTKNANVERKYKHTKYI